MAGKQKKIVKKNCELYKKFKFQKDLMTGEMGHFIPLSCFVDCGKTQSLICIEKANEFRKEQEKEWREVEQRDE